MKGWEAEWSPESVAGKLWNVHQKANGWNWHRLLHKQYDLTLNIDRHDHRIATHVPLYKAGIKNNIIFMIFYVDHFM